MFHSWLAEPYRPSRWASDPAFGIHLRFRSQYLGRQGAIDMLTNEVATVTNRSALTATGTGPPGLLQLTVMARASAESLRPIDTRPARVVSATQAGPPTTERFDNTKPERNDHVL